MRPKQSLGYGMNALPKIKNPEGKQVWKPTKQYFYLGDMKLRITPPNISFAAPSSVASYHWAFTVHCSGRV